MPERKMGGFQFCNRVKYYCYVVIKWAARYRENTWWKSDVFDLVEYWVLSQVPYLHCGNLSSITVRDNWLLRSVKCAFKSIIEDNIVGTRSTDTEPDDTFPQALISILTVTVLHSLEFTDPPIHYSILKVWSNNIHYAILTSAGGTCHVLLWGPGPVQQWVLPEKIELMALYGSSLLQFTARYCLMINWDPGPLWQFQGSFYTMFSCSRQCLITQLVPTAASPPSERALPPDEVSILHYLDPNPLPGVFTIIFYDPGIAHPLSWRATSWTLHKSVLLRQGHGTHSLVILCQNMCERWASSSYPHSCKTLQEICSAFSCLIGRYLPVGVHSMIETGPHAEFYVVLAGFFSKFQQHQQYNRHNRSKDKSVGLIVFIAAEACKYFLFLIHGIAYIIVVSRLSSWMVSMAVRRNTSIKKHVNIIWIWAVSTFTPILFFPSKRDIFWQSAWESTWYYGTRYCTATKSILEYYLRVRQSLSHLARHVGMKLGHTQTTLVEVYIVSVGSSGFPQVGAKIGRPGHLDTFVFVFYQAAVIWRIAWICMDQVNYNIIHELLPQPTSA